ncbi:hypothetical protein Rleg5DRAFT_1460 [Rhizobium leguminosarum bv. viciae WSM1455]|nr:hypothetical protein Rleg5DRAFT_1460 [Rhizobium leguminosarum bv. viciae WSM1455]
MSDSWRDGLRLKLEDFVDAMVVNGAKQSTSTTPSSKRSEASEPLMNAIQSVPKIG